MTVVLFSALEPQGQESRSWSVAGAQVYMMRQSADGGTWEV